MEPMAITTYTDGSNAFRRLFLSEVLWSLDQMIVEAEATGETKVVAAAHETIRELVFYSTDDRFIANVVDGVVWWLPDVMGVTQGATYAMIMYVVASSYKVTRPVQRRYPKHHWRNIADDNTAQHVPRVPADIIEHAACICFYVECIEGMGGVSNLEAGGTGFTHFLPFDCNEWKWDLP